MSRGFLLAFVALVAAIGLWHPARVAIQTLLLLPALFPSAPLDPLSLVTAAPVREQHSYVYTGGSVDADLFYPAGGDRHGAIILLLGAGDLPRSDLAVHFAEGLARLGVVTLVPESSGMRAERMTFDEVDAIRTSLDLLDARSDVDANRVGVVGLSASGGLSIVAAGQSDLRDRIRFINSFGSYSDASTLLLDVSSRSMSVEGQVRPWQPEARTVEVVANTLREVVPNAVIREVERGTSRQRADAAITNLPSAARERLNRVSPATYLKQLHAHLYVMHDQDDPFIPFTESRDLVARAPAGVVQRYTEFSIFAHVIPEKPVPWQTFLPDLWRLYWHAHAVLLEVL
jgi:acetyl esterase/lipase